LVPKPGRLTQSPGLNAVVDLMTDVREKQALANVCHARAAINTGATFILEGGMSGV
jgi:hypothetical protein